MTSIKHYDRVRVECMQRIQLREEFFHVEGSYSQRPWNVSLELHAFL
jgi:hypothetical protein